MNNENITALTPGTCFHFKGFEWVALGNNVDGGVLAIMASSWKNGKYSFDENGCNNYAKSSLRRNLRDELLPVLGEDNLISHKIDLVADTGDDRYGTIADKVFVLSCDEYRRYRKHVPLFSEWTWTCTPWYISDTGDGCYVRGIGTDRVIGYSSAKINYGVATACVFNPEKLKIKNAIIQLVEV